MIAAHNLQPKWLKTDVSYRFELPLACLDAIFRNQLAKCDRSICEKCLSTMTSSARRPTTHHYRWLESNCHFLKLKRSKIFRPQDLQIVDDVNQLRRYVMRYRMPMCLANGWNQICITCLVRIERIIESSSNVDIFEWTWKYNKKPTRICCDVPTYGCGLWM